MARNFICSAAFAFLLALLASPATVIMAVGVIASVVLERPALAETQKEQAVPKSQGQTGKDSPFGIFGVFDAYEHPTFIRDMKKSGKFVTDADYYVWIEEHFQDLGVKWSRQNTLLIWGLVEPESGKGYNWQAKGGEEVVENAYKYGGSDFNLVLVIDPGRKSLSGRPTVVMNREDEKHFKDFVKAAVRKYGDKVKYWQAFNEPFPGQWRAFGGTPKSYIQFLRAMSEAVKEADPGAKIVLGSVIADGNSLSGDLITVINQLNGEKLFDVVDMHYWNYAKDYKLNAAKEMRSLLDSHGCKDVEIWSMEHGTYVNQPTKGGAKIEYQSEKDQAISLIKRYAYNLANNVNKIFWNKIVEHSCFAGKCGGLFDNIGLVSDGRNSGETAATLGIPRLSYYSYKKMTQILAGSDWNNIQTVREYGGVYLYKFMRSGKPVWVAWNDNEDKRRVRIRLEKDTQNVKITEAVPKYESGKEVADYKSAFREVIRRDFLESYPPQLVVEIGSIPVFMEEN